MPYVPPITEIPGDYIIIDFKMDMYPTNLVLAGNPVRLDIMCATSTNQFSYQITSGDTVYYTGSGEGFFSVFIQDILSRIVQPVKLHNEDPKVIISVPDIMKRVRITAESSSGLSPLMLDFKTLVGGVSKRTLRRLNDENSNIFLMKLLNSASNFLMTTRTTKRIISIRETELLPIPFLYPDSELKVKSGELEVSLSGIAGSPYALNLFRLRKNWFEEYQVLASVFEIYSGDVLSFTVVIVPGTVSKERYLLEFLNSWGAYERVEVTGTGIIESEAGEDQTYMNYDALVDDYIEARDRTESRNILNVESGFKTPSEFGFLLDMLASDDIRILGLDGRNIKVNATAENLTQAARSTSPESLKLSLRFADSETLHTGTLSEEDFGSPRIHTEQFTQEFN